MEAFLNGFGAHAAMLQKLGAVGFVLFLLLAIVGLMFRRSIRVRQTADRGGVIVNGDNRGSINTGHIGAAPAAEPGLLEKLAFWATILGFPLALAALAITVLAWRFPVSPS